MKKRSMMRRMAVLGARKRNRIGLRSRFGFVRLWMWMFGRLLVTAALRCSLDRGLEFVIRGRTGQLVLLFCSEGLLADATYQRPGLQFRRRKREDAGLGATAMVFL